MRVLILDDNDGSRKLLTRYLIEHAEISAAKNGIEAVEAFAQAMQTNKRFDLICLDYMMPGIDGIQVLERIRQMERDHHIQRTDRTKVIMVSVVNEDSDVQRAFFSGCDSYIIKPVRRERLLDEIHSFGLIAQNI